MNNQPIVSVLMTAYNRVKYIGGAIESVLSSTLQDFELIVVDDGSTDGTV
jgi:glycosyltransferase involved in cell wall biosynthesis